MADLDLEPKGLEEGIRRMESQLQSFVAYNKQRLDKLETDHNQLTSMLHSIINKPPKIKLKFPEFDLENLKGWIFRCNNLFHLCQIPENKKMAYVALNIKGEADIWYQCYVKENGGSVTWEKFCVDICQRFGPEPMDVMAKFRSLEQTEEMDVEQYLVRFEKVMCDMVDAYPGLQEMFYVSCFIAGLKPEIKTMVDMKNPTSIIVAFKVAKLQEKYLIALDEKEEE